MAPTTLAPADAKTAATTLQNLQSVANAIKKDIESFGGNPALVSTFLNQDLALLAKIDEMTQKLPATPLSEISAAYNDLSALKDSYNSFLASYQGEIYDGANRRIELF